MAIVIRLSRQGRRNRPHYRLGVFDRRTRRDGPPIEYLGHYNPLETDDEKKAEDGGFLSVSGDLLTELLDERGIAHERRCWWGRIWKQRSGI